MSTVRTRVTRPFLASVLAASVLAPAGCASAPPVVQAPVIPIEQKMSWILQLEDQRILRVDPPPPVAEPVPPPRRRRAGPPPPPPTYPDLVALVADAEPRIRRRAALAIGRGGLKEGVPPLVGALADADADVRAQAAFALGLLGDASASAPLVTALADVDPKVRGRAAEALGLIGSKDAADAIGRMAAEYAKLPAVSGMKPDDETWPAVSPEADAFRLAAFALVRLGAFEPLAAAVLGPGGEPVTSWWPVAFALQRIGDTRAQPALTRLLQTPGTYTRAFAARGLGGLKDPASVDLLLPLLAPKAAPVEVMVSAVRAVAQLGDPRAAAPLIALVSDATAPPNLRLEAVTALGTLRSEAGLPVVQDLITAEWPTMRIAALRAAAAIDREHLLLVLSSLEPDREWIVRAALAEVIGQLPGEVAVPRLREMLKSEEDRRVLPAVLRALVRLKVPDAMDLVIPQLKAPDFALRAVAASLVGQNRPEGGAAALRDAYTFALADAAYDARVELLSALAAYGPAEATETLKTALADKDWAVRVRARTLLEKLEPSADYRMAIRPAPSSTGASYDAAALVTPPYSPHVFIETDRGTVEFELTVLDAPQTSRNFIALARKGFFNGLRIHRVVANFVVQDGDSRGDGQGGPGYTIRDELNERPFLRGTVGMALAGPDTGGSQFFVMHSPAPHLDARYTVFGRVVSGMEVVDRLQQGDGIVRVRVWDGKTW
jgi:cyclophilin family peptidyl-prolyl cis-trans isomerase/HEAT repeat protein